MVGPLVGPCRQSPFQKLSLILPSHSSKFISRSFAMVLIHLDGFQSTCQPKQHKSHVGLQSAPAAVCQGFSGAQCTDYQRPASLITKAFLPPCPLFSTDVIVQQICHKALNHACAQQSKENFRQEQELSLSKCS